MADKFTTGIDLPNLTSGQARPASAGFIRIFARTNELYGMLPDGSEVEFNPFDNSVLVQGTTSSISIIPQSITFLCDCSLNDIVIQLPDPLLSVVDGYSYQIAVSRADLSTNSLTIIPFSTEKIIGQSSIDLKNGEVLNFITNGTDWYLGA